MKILTATTLAGLIFVLSGCATTSPPEQAAEVTSAPPVRLTRGASGQMVRDALGNPDRIEAVKDNAAAEVWVYRRTVRQRVRMVEATMQDTLVFQPENLATGMKTIQVPVQHLEQDVLQEVLLLIIVNDQLSDWSRTFKEVVAGPILR